VSHASPSPSGPTAEQPEPDAGRRPTSRRQVVLLGTAVVVCGGALTGCGSDGAQPVAGDPATTSAGTTSAGTTSADAASPADTTTSTTSTSETHRTASTTRSATGSGPKASPSSSAEPDFSAGALAKLTSIPVGGAVVASGIVITRTSAAAVVGHSARCTHQGCQVAAQGGRLECPCHGSTFDLRSGTNLSGPAPSPLPAVRLVVKGGYVHRG
jgi:Rieske Fe-S protein